MNAHSVTHKVDGGTVEVGTVTHEGREFSALGAVVGGEHHRVISSRPAVFFGHRSFWGDRYYYMRATVGGAEYAIRGFGDGMLARGKRVR